MRGFAIAAMIAALTACSDAGGSDYATNDEPSSYDDLTAENDELRAQVDSLQGELDDAQSKLEEAEASVQEVTTAAQQLRDEVDRFRRDDWRDVVRDVDSATDDLGLATSEAESVLAY